MKNTTAIILAAGQGKRMQSDIQKQYLCIYDKPIIYYTLKAFEESFVSEIILVVGQGEIEYCKKDIIDYYQFKKVKKMVEGGKERYHSVYSGLQAIENTDYVFIHDGARPCVTLEILEDAYQAVLKYDVL